MGLPQIEPNLADCGRSNNQRIPGQLLQNMQFRGYSVWWHVLPSQVVWPSCSYCTQPRRNSGSKRKTSADKRPSEKRPSDKRQGELSVGVLVDAHLTKHASGGHGM